MKIYKMKTFWAIILIIILLILAFSFGFFRNGHYETVEVQRADLTKIVEISGKVVPAEEVELSFSASSNVTRIYKDVGDFVKAGDVLAEIDSSQVQEEISEARANLNSSNSKLNELVGSDNSEIYFKKDKLIKTLEKAYINSTGIIENEIDVFFENPNSRFPDFTSSLGSYFIRLDINEKRYELKRMFEDWKVEVDNYEIATVSYEDAYKTIERISQVEELLAIIAANAFEFEPNNTISQTRIDSYLADVSAGRTTLTNLSIDVSDVMDSLRSSEANIPVQSAEIANSQATVSRLQSKAGDYVLRAPFDGQITENNLELGKYKTAGESAFILISDSPLEIETFIPEINIVGVDVGDDAILKFDALPNTTIDSVITHIDPKETIKDGVVTYRTLINLISPNENLRPGMSVDIEIIKEKIFDQITLPTYVIQEEDDKSFVQKKRGDELEKIEVEILDNDNRGTVSISGEIFVGDQIIIPQEN